MPKSNTWLLSLIALILAVIALLAPYALTMAPFPFLTLAVILLCIAELKRG